MKKLLMITIIATVACVIAVTTSTFAEQKTIAITATVSGTQGVSLSTGSWGIGPISTGATPTSSTITATNTGSAPETLELSAVTAGDFSLATDAAADTIAIWGQCASSDPGLTNANALIGTPGQTSASVDPAANLTVYMKYNAPTSITGAKSDGAVDITVSTLP